MLPPHADSEPKAAISAKTDSIARQARRRDGIRRKIRNAKTAQPAHPRLSPPFFGLDNSPERLAVVIVTVAVPVVTPLVRVTAELAAEQVGIEVALAGEAVSAQLRVTDPT